ncbi:MAG TPA: winged helix DNA-binding domain-containing protein [Gemmatimonadaceae bacterium]|nr:winged helix DNA-binding domain-containing protein [Gemmatimonadaceae bacterium]
MPKPDIARQRLINHGLVKPTLKTASEVVARLGAVQAQDYGASKWGIAQRTDGLTDVRIEKEVDDGTIVRTHVLRPTWHFVVAADIGWMLALTAPRVHAANAHWYRWLEVDDAVARRSRTVLTKALRDGKHLTRAELGEALTRAKIQVSSPVRLACIVMRAELDGVICSGARRGKQFTYALLEERVAKPTALEHDAALFELARRYFMTRGPATVDDFAWWSGLTKADAKRGVEGAATHLEHESIEGRSYWFPVAERTVRASSSLTHLLPNYDEYFIGFKDRSAFSVRLTSSGVKPRTDALSGHILIVNGQIVGGWRRTLVRRTVVVEPKPLIRLSETERRSVGVAARRFGRFLALPVKTRWR